MASPTLAAVPPNNSRNERDTGAFSSATGTPTWTDHPSVPARTRWTVSTSMPSRVWVRGEFEPPRAMASCTAGVFALALAVFVSGVRATIFSLASMTVPAHPAGSPA